MPGKTIIDFNDNGKYDFVTGVDKQKFLDLLEEKLKKFDDFKLN